MYSLNGYLEAVRSGEPAKITVQLATGTGIDETAWDDLEAIEASRLPMSSDVTQLSDKDYSIDPNLATFEGDGIPTSATAKMIVPPTSSGSSIRTGLWSDTISDSEGKIEWGLVVTMSAPHTSAFTVYSDGEVLITSAKITFSLNGSSVQEGEMTVDGDRVYWGESVTYDEVAVTITSISEPYHHVRVSEIDFGAMVSVPSVYLDDIITWVQEVDPLQQTTPLSELDFSVINVDGTWDDDLEEGQSQAFQNGTLMTASIRSVIDGKAYVVPLGRYVIAGKRQDIDSVQFTCYDLRYRLKAVPSQIHLSLSVSLGTTIAEVLGEAYIPHTLDGDVMELMPDADADLSGMSVFDALAEVQQAYNLSIVPLRTGMIHVSVGVSSDDYGDLPQTQMTEYAKPDNEDSYNIISVGYGNNQYAIDLRGAEAIKSTLAVDNDLITTEARAKTLAEDLKDALYPRAVEIEYVGDALVDAGDSLTYTSRAGKRYKAQVLYHTVEYDGALTETVRCAVRGNAISDA